MTVTQDIQIAESIPNQHTIYIPIWKINSTNK